MEMSEDVYDGQPVYADVYIDKRHNAFGDDALPIVKGSFYVGGWDCGQTIIPAFVLWQITPMYQCHRLLEVVSRGGESMETFAPRVTAALAARIPHCWDEVEHVGDATVTQRSGSTGETAQSVAKKHGVYIRPMSNEWQSRLSAVVWSFFDDIQEDIPRTLIDGRFCPILRQAFRGAYRYEESKTGDSQGPGMVLAKPKKNSFSHIADADQYAAVYVRRKLQGRGFTRKEVKPSMASLTVRGDALSIGD